MSLASLLQQMDAELFPLQQGAHPVAYKRMEVWLIAHGVTVICTNPHTISDKCSHGTPSAVLPEWKDTARKVFDALCAAHHPSSCRKAKDTSADCTCGRDAAFKAWDAMAEIQNAFDLENE